MTIDFRLGEAAVEWSLEQLQLGDVEVPPGSNGGAYIARLFAPATRLIAGSERRLGIASGNWCAVGACAAAVASGTGMSDVHGYRASGVELEADARRLGSWRPLAWTPSLGDLCVLYRSGGEPWWRHVVRVLDHRTKLFTSIGANEGQRWRVTTRWVDEQIVGWIEYPHPVVPADRGAPSRLDPLRDVMISAGLDTVQGLIDRLGDDLVG